MCRCQQNLDILIRLSLQLVCFAAGHRAIFKNDLNNVDVVFRKLLRSVVGPPAATDWSRPWHEILHDWNARVAQFVQVYPVKRW